MFSDTLRANLLEVCNFFEQSIKKNKLVHAYLLQGKDNNLKDEFAYELTSILNCKKLNTDGSPCKTACINCLWLNKKEHPELPIILEPDLSKSKKGVILLRQIIPSSSYPESSKEALLTKLQSTSNLYRIIIVKAAEKEYLPAEPANAMLKTIEEPGNRCLFLFYVQDIKSVLPTIISRCQLIHFPNIHIEDSTFSLGQELQELFIKKQSFLQISQLVASNLNDKETLLNDLYCFCLKKAEEKINYKYQWLRSLQTLELAQKRLNQFCSPKAVLEELFWDLNIQHTTH